MSKRVRMGKVYRPSGEPLERRQCLATSLTVTLAKPAVMEGEPHQVSVTLSAASTQVERVLVSLSDDTASYGRDYFGMLTQQLAFMPGQTTKTVSIPTLRDSVSEAVETFVITATPVNPRIRAGSVTARIVEYQTPREITVADATVVEGDVGATTTAAFLVTLSGPAESPVTVDYETRDRTATTRGGDYRSTSGTITFAAGETSKVISVQVSGDDIEEDEETFELVLTDATNGRIVQAIGTGTILDDDAPEDVNQPGFQITLEFVASPFGDVPDDVRQLAQAAADRWSQIIVGDLPLVDEGGILIDDLLFTVQMGLLGGEQNAPGGVLANAGPTRFRNGVAGLPSMAITGIDPFDAGTQSAFGRQALYETILHEMGHGLGFTPGTVVFNRFIDEANAAFVGANALEAYNSIFGIAATGVPLAPDTLAHWDEFVFRTELMTPISDPGFNQISRITVGALADMGYEVNYAAADAYAPIPQVVAPPSTGIDANAGNSGESGTSSPVIDNPSPRQPDEPASAPAVWAVDPVTRRLPAAPWRPTRPGQPSPTARIHFGPTVWHMTAGQRDLFRSLVPRLAIAAAFGELAANPDGDRPSGVRDPAELFAAIARI